MVLVFSNYTNLNCLWIIFPSHFILEISFETCVFALGFHSLFCATEPASWKCSTILAKSYNPYDLNKLRFNADGDFVVESYIINYFSSLIVKTLCCLYLHLEEFIGYFFDMEHQKWNTHPWTSQFRCFNLSSNFLFYFLVDSNQVVHAQKIRNISYITTRLMVTSLRNCGNEEKKSFKYHIKECYYLNVWSHLWYKFF